jgi:hypothetical protein
MRVFFRQSGVMSDLNAMIPTNSPLYLLVACCINDRDQIAGLALEVRSGELHGFLACQDGMRRERLPSSSNLFISRADEFLDHYGEIFREQELIKRRVCSLRFVSTKGFTPH